MEHFPRNLSFIHDGRQLEIESFSPGRRSNEFSYAPAAEVIPLLGGVDDAQETTERLDLIEHYLAHATRAFKERGLRYPFTRSKRGDSLSVIPGRRAFARLCVGLTELCGRDNAAHRAAKEFERRAVSALHRLIGGNAICVGAPRDEGTGPRKAIRALRTALASESRSALPADLPNSGDLGADAFWILGREWGGPLAYFQAKNTAFNLGDLPPEFLRVSEVLLAWFGRRMDQHRSVIPVFAVNTVFTTELKETAFAAAGRSGYHILDAVDILAAEQMKRPFHPARHPLTFM